MQGLPHRRVGVVRAGCFAVFSACLAAAAAANPLPSVPAPGGGECEAMAASPEIHGLWLGHFTGGRFVRDAAIRALDWRDQYSCFPSDRACQTWQRHLVRVYRRVQGYRTCMPLR
ncbi:MAG TPA: hypothetical protein VG271_03170 [Beijerinckiaceae bacterium]|jgi:hypothetical protein|nr:hypothetical protein [Beijerinckiaceae bacterium]